MASGKQRTIMLARKPPTLPTIPPTLKSPLAPPPQPSKQRRSSVSSVLDGASSSHETTAEPEVRQRPPARRDGETEEETDQEGEEESGDDSEYEGDSEDEGKGDEHQQHPSSSLGGGKNPVPIDSSSQHHHKKNVPLAPLAATSVDARKPSSTLPAAEAEEEKLSVLFEPKWSYADQLETVEANTLAVVPKTMLPLNKDDAAEMIVNFLIKSDDPDIKALIKSDDPDMKATARFLFDSLDPESKKSAIATMVNFNKWSIIHEINHNIQKRKREIETALQVMEMLHMSNSCM